MADNFKIEYWLPIIRRVVGPAVFPDLPVVPMTQFRRKGLPHRRRFEYPLKDELITCKLSDVPKSKEDLTAPLRHMIGRKLMDKELPAAPEPSVQGWNDNPFED